MSRKLWVLILTGFFVSACGGSADNAVSDEESYDDADYADDSYSDDSYSDDEEEGVFDPLVGTIDRAKAVEDTNMQRKDEMDAAIEANE
jgi:hypothetical protein